MNLFDYMQSNGHEQVAFWYDKDVGLKAIIAIHDSTLGPALGGIRMYPYPSEEAALTDVLRLSEAMSYKASVAGLNLGGGKAVIIGDPRYDKSEALFRSMGRFVDSLNGRYQAAEDVGITEDDIAVVAQETQHVTGVPGQSGDPSPLTAYGVYRGIKAACQFRFGSDSLAGRTVAVQGIGKVGYALLGHLAKEGAKLVVTDVNEQAVAQAQADYGAKAVGLDEIYEVEADIFSPCALGAVLNDQTIPRLKCQIVAGAANNQLAEDRHGEALERRGILYTPDYVINAGGIINVIMDLGAFGPEEAQARATAIYDTTLNILNRARTAEIPTAEAALQVAKERIASGASKQVSG